MWLHSDLEGILFSAAAIEDLVQRSAHNQSDKMHLTNVQIHAT